jgi:hypothetical protein
VVDEVARKDDVDILRLFEHFQKYFLDW